MYATLTDSNGSTYAVFSEQALNAALDTSFHHIVAISYADSGV